MHQNETKKKRKKKKKKTLDNSSSTLLAGVIFSVMALLTRRSKAEMAFTFAAIFRSSFENTIIDPAVMLCFMSEHHES